MSIKQIDILVLILYCGFIYWLSNQQTLPTPMWFDQQDKFYHAGAYGLMGLLAWRSFRHFIQTPIILALVSIAFCSLYGLSDEWHQSFVIGRNSSRYDWMADTFGALIGVLLLSKLNAATTANHHEMAQLNCSVDCENCSFHEQHAADPLNPER